MFGPGSEIFIVGLGSFFIGVILTALISQFMRRGHHAEAQNVTSTQSAANENEWLNINLNPNNGRLNLRLRGQRLTVVDEVADPNLRAALHTVMDALYRSANSSASTPSSSTFEPPAASIPSIPPVALTTTNPAPSTPTESALLSTQPTASLAESPSAPDLAAPDQQAVSGSFIERLRDSFQKPDYVKEPTFVLPTPAAKKPATPKAPPPPPSTDMFTAINLILQRHWRAQNEVPPVEIVGGVDTLQIRYGGQLYQRIDDIPHAGAQQLIRAAIAEWDR